MDSEFRLRIFRVLNLVISGIPSILQSGYRYPRCRYVVLNLVISGIPSIHLIMDRFRELGVESFKPCYKWNTFNTYCKRWLYIPKSRVLNLVISGIPSIL